MKVYLAGPDVFLPDAKDIGRRKKDICARLGLSGLFPLDNDISDSETGVGAGAPLSMRIFRSCVAMMEDADAVIAHLTPFRSPSADAGTVFELGYMAARRKLCTGYTNRPGSYADRVERARTADAWTGDLPGPGLEDVDREGHVIENFGLADNLMIVHALDTSGCPLFAPAAEPADLWRDLTLFTKCAEWIAGRARRTG
jgi:nucleoside 2-deoxyribosyltransferase